MNKVMLVGRLAADPETRTTQSGITACSFRIAVQRRFANADGVREADFISCVAWRQTADFIAKYFRKGNRIGLEGAIQTRTYDKDGVTHYVTEVLVDNVEFVESNGGGNNTQNQAPATPANRAGFTEVSDDELPF